MIEQLKGVVENKNDSFLILSINGFGLKLLMSKNGIESMPNVGKEVLVLTYLHVKEDALDLFGFYSNRERETFLLLISINGIGPKLALTILSGMGPLKLNNNILNEDVKSLTAISGVGTKTANRIILELKDKVSLDDNAQKLSLETNENKQLFLDSVNALISLGYKKNIAKDACDTLQKKGELNGAIEVVIKKALDTIMS
jgi:Holliday junction DNA helicase RuvA